jgi:dihydrofolate reductase
MLNVIVAYCKNRGIGVNNKIPWKLKTDMKMFKQLTIGNNRNAVIMGRKTWESLPNPLSNRTNIILSNTVNEFEGGITKRSLFDAREYCRNNNIEVGWVIGGSSLYEEVIFGGEASLIYVTDIENDFKCDTFFTEIPNNYKLISQSCVNAEKDITFKFKLLKKV